MTQKNFRTSEEINNEMLEIEKKQEAGTATTEENLKYTELDHELHEAWRRERFDPAAALREQ